MLHTQHISITINTRTAKTLSDAKSYHGIPEKLEFPRSIIISSGTSATTSAAVETVECRASPVTTETSSSYRSRKLQQSDCILVFMIISDKLGLIGLADVPLAATRPSQQS